MVAAHDFAARLIMLSLKKISIRSANYYLELAHEHYYIQGGEPPGEWHGEGAKALGLSGRVTGETFHNLFQGFSPDGTRSLVQNAGKKDGYHKRVPGWDLTFSPPKSVSVCWALAPEPMRKAIERVHEEAVRKTLALVEEHAGITRSGSGGWKREDAALCFALFQHGTSRAQDPQLHTHAVCFNIGHRANAGWGSLKSDQMYELKTAFGTLYRCQLAYLLQKELSYPVEKSGAFFEVKGVDRDIIEFFSTRRAQIIDYCRKHGGYDAMLAEKAALETRTEKAHLARGSLFAAWANAAAEQGWSADKVVQLQTWKAVKTSWTADMKDLAVDIEAALRASIIKPSKAETLLTVAEVMQTSGLSARQILAATYEALGRSKTKLAPSGKKTDHQFADRLSEAQANTQTERESKAKEESEKRREEFVKKWEESAAKHKVEREGREKEERSRRIKTARPYKPIAAKATRKRRSGFAVVKIGRPSKNRPYPFGTIDLRVFNVELHSNRPFHRAPWLSPFHYLKLPAFAVTSDLAPHKIWRRLTIPLRDAKHAALSQIRESLVTAFKTGAKLVWIRDERIEKLGQSIKDGSRFLRQFQKPRVLVGKSDGHAWRGVLDDWERAGGMTRPEGNLVLCQTRGVAERLNADIQKQRRNQGRVGLRSIQVGEETLHQNDRVIFRTSSTRTDIQDMDKVSIGDLGTVTKVDGNRIAIRTDAGAKVEMNVKEAPDIRLAYAVIHDDAASTNPRKSFILFEGNRPELEYEAIQRQAATCPVRVYVGPELAECFTVEGQRELKHRLGIREMEAHDKARDAEWKKEAQEQKATTETKSQGPSGNSTQGSSEKATQGDQPNGTSRTASSYWNAKETPTPQFFEDQRKQREQQDRVERATELREAKEDRDQEAKARKARQEAKQDKERSESSETTDQATTAKPIVGRTPFQHVADTESYLKGEGVPRPSPFEASRDQRKQQDRVERTTEQRETKEDRNRDAEDRKAQRAAKQAHESSASCGQAEQNVVAPMVSPSPTYPGSDTKLNRTINGGLARGLSEKERHQEEVERRMEEERRRREEEEKRRQGQLGKATTQSNSSQSHSHSHSHSH